MTTITIDIPSNKTDEVLTLLKKFGIKIVTSEPSKLNKFTKEDYEKHFSHQSQATRDEVLKYL